MGGGGVYTSRATGQTIKGNFKENRIGCLRSCAAPMWYRLFTSSNINVKLLSTYLIFVIFLTEAKFLENKIYTEKRVNYDKLHSKLPILCVNYHIVTVTFLVTTQDNSGRGQTRNMTILVATRIAFLAVRRETVNWHFRATITVSKLRQITQ